jgi:hypothetical protein
MHDDGASYGDDNSDPHDDWDGGDGGGSPQAPAPPPTLLSAGAEAAKRWTGATQEGTADKPQLQWTQQAHFRPLKVRTACSNFVASPRIRSLCLQARMAVSTTSAFDP